MPERFSASHRPRSRHALPRARLTLDQLRIFAAVAEREHLTNAAEALHLSQGSVSTQVHNLEQALGVPLLHRVGRNVRLTDIGRAVYRHAVALLESAYAIEDMGTGSVDEVGGELRLVVGPVIGAHRLSAWLGPFVREHPTVDVQMSIAPMQAAVEALSSAEADVAILGAGVTASGFEMVTLEQTELVIVVSSEHPLASRQAPLKELAAHRHLAHEHGSATQVHAASVLGHAADLSPTIELEEAALLATLHAGLGFAVMPRAIVEADIATGRLTVLPRRGKPVTVAFTAVRRNGAQTPAVEMFWEHLLSVGQG